MDSQQLKPKKSSSHIFRKWSFHSSNALLWASRAQNWSHGRKHCDSYFKIYLFYKLFNKHFLSIPIWESTVPDAGGWRRKNTTKLNQALSRPSQEIIMKRERPMKVWTRKRGLKGMMLSEGRFQTGPQVLGCLRLQHGPTDRAEDSPQVRVAHFIGHLALPTHAVCAVCSLHVLMSLWTLMCPQLLVNTCFTLQLIAHSLKRNDLSF